LNCAWGIHFNQAELSVVTRVFHNWPGIPGFSHSFVFKRNNGPIWVSQICGNFSDPFQIFDGGDQGGETYFAKKGLMKQTRGFLKQGEPNVIWGLGNRGPLTPQGL